MSELQTLEASAKKVFAFGVSHLVLIGALALSLIGGVFLYDSKRADIATAAASLAEAKATALAQQNSQLQAATTKELSDLEQQNEVLQAQYKTLQTQFVALASQRTAAQTQVKELPPAEVQKDLEAKLGGSLTDVEILRKDDSIVTDYPIVLQQNTVLTSEVQSQSTTVSNLQQSLQLETSAHASDVTTCKAQLAADATTLKAVKAQARKSKFKWFIAGVITGIIGGHAAGI